MSTHAEAARAVRAELKKTFPSTKFAVTSKSYAGGNSIRASWVDGPAEKEIMKIIGKYQYGNFDGMQDLYEMSNCRNDIPQVKYVFTDRKISQSILESLYQREKAIHNGWENLTGLDDTSMELMNKCKFWTPREYIMHHYIRDTDLTNGYQAA